MRELTRGKFIVKNADITLMETIGAGCSCLLYKLLIELPPLSGEFGIVYKAKLGPTGRNSRDVAVKTLKGMRKSVMNMIAIQQIFEIIYM